MKLCRLLQSKLTAGTIQTGANTHKLGPAMCLQSCCCRNPLDKPSRLLGRNNTYSVSGSLPIVSESSGKLSFSAGQVSVLL